MRKTEERSLRLPFYTDCIIVVIFKNVRVIGCSSTLQNTQISTGEVQ